MANEWIVGNNTILIPSHDGLVDEHQLADNKLASSLDAVSDVTWVKDSQGKIANAESIYISVLGTTTVTKKITNIQSVSGFEMSRENKSIWGGGDGKYMVNLPGRITYSDITITHIYTKEHFFLDWLINGVYFGGISRANIEIHISPDSKTELVFTLYDAFPTKWDLSTDLNLYVPEGGSAEILMEEVTLTYSKVKITGPTDIKKS